MAPSFGLEQDINRIGPKFSHLLSAASISAAAARFSIPLLEGQAHFFPQAEAKTGGCKIQFQPPPLRTNPSLSRDPICGENSIQELLLSSLVA